MKLPARAAAIAFIAVAAVPLGCAAPGAGLALEDGRIVAPSANGALKVTVSGSDTPLFGEVRTERDRLVFEPRFPFKPGVEYRAVFEGSGGRLERTFTLPSPPPSPPTVVTAVFPGRDVLPENLLKFYLHFSAPMSRREAYQRVRLLDGAGKPVELPFLEIGEELWDRAGTRLTLLFDPGRIKRGLKPREDSGPALEEGKSYTLVVDAGWPDAEGRPLKQGHRKAFKVVAPDDKQPDPKTWKVTPPRRGSTDPLTVEFEESLDEAMLNRSLAVRDPQDKPVEGRIEVDRHETRWRFHPSAAWKGGAHALAVDTVLEDMAGNSIDRPFEVDVLRPSEGTIKPKLLRLPFVVD
jgi:hypothetical protein